MKLRIEFGIGSKFLNSLRFEHYGKYAESNTCHMVDSIPIWTTIKIWFWNPIRTKKSVSDLDGTVLFSLGFKIWYFVWIRAKYSPYWNGCKNWDSNLINQLLWLWIRMWRFRISTPLVDSTVMKYVNEMDEKHSDMPLPMLSPLL